MNLTPHDVDGGHRKHECEIERRKLFCQQTTLICAPELTELCLAKSCFISLIHLSKIT